MINPPVIKAGGFFGDKQSMKIKGDLTKAKLFELTDDIEIFAKYLDIRESTIINCIETGELIPSPLRFDDNNASAGFKYSTKNNLRFRDFSGYFWGDCFDLVAFLLGKHSNNKQDFMEILKDIHETVVVKGRDKMIKTAENRKKLDAVVKAKRVIDIETREFNLHDYHYWNDMLYKERDVFGYLLSMDVYPVLQMWIDRDSQPAAKYTYSKNDPCYAYFFGYDANDIANYKLYFPFRKHPFPKFITNCNSYQGFRHLREKVDALVFTKSYKDVISMKSFLRFNNKTIDIIAPPSENHVLTLQEYLWFKSHVKGKFGANQKAAILSIYDFDRTGLIGSGELKRNHGVDRFMFTNGKYGTKVIGNKDFTDTIPFYGKTEFFKLINNFINKLEIV